jgi:anti-anti-sigma factor
MYKFEIPPRLDATNAAEVEEQILTTIASEKLEVLVCDFSQTGYISSAGLRVMLVAAKKLKQQGRALQLHNLQDSVAEVFRLAGMHTILDIR